MHSYMQDMALSASTPLCPEKYNSQLKGELRDLLDAIDKRSYQMTKNRRPLNSSLNIDGSMSSVSTRQELDLVNSKIARLKLVIEKDYQVSSMRVLEDHIKETRQRLIKLEDEITAVDRIGEKQKYLLSSTAPSRIVTSLQEEFAKEKLLNRDLRKTGLALERGLRVRGREELFAVQSEVARLKQELHDLVCCVCVLCV